MRTKHKGSFAVLHETSYETGVHRVRRESRLLVRNPLKSPVTFLYTLLDIDAIRAEMWTQGLG